MGFWFLADAPTVIFRLVLSAIVKGGFSTAGSVLIPGFAALASTAVAIVSVVIANRAKNIAEASERARIEAEAVRVRREQQQRFDTAIRELFVGVANLMRDIELHEHAVADWKRSFSIATQQTPPHPQPPSDMSLLALVAAARLEAEHKDERDMLDAVHKVITDIRKADPRYKRMRLARLWESVVDWRHADVAERSSVLRKFHGIVLSKTAEDATRK